MRLARELGFETVVVDGRAAFATPERFPDVDRLVVGWPDEVADEIGLGPNDAVAVLTHDVKFDEPAIVEALRRGCRYVGAVGSQKTQADRRARLLEAGVSEAELARLRGPVGLDLGGRAPAETALAILAEIVAERYGGTGAPMRERALARRLRSPRDDGDDADATVGLVLAAGAGSRFGGGKLLAPIGGRPILQHVLDALADGRHRRMSSWSSGAMRPPSRRPSTWRAERRVVNPDPEPRAVELARARVRGHRTRRPARSSSRSGDQPLVSGRGHPRPARRARPTSGRPFVVPVYADERGRNPVLLRRPAFGLVAEATGDRGLGPVLAAHPDLVAEVAVDGRQPGRGHAGRPRPRRSRPPGRRASAPTASRSSASARSPTGPTSTPRSTRSSGPIPTRTDDAGPRRAAPA